MEITLRELSLTDLDVTYKWHSDSNLSDLILSYPPPISKENERKWLINIVSKETKNKVVFGICETKTNLLIGLIQIHNIDQTHKCAYLGMFIADNNFRGKGYGAKALLQTLEYAFNTLKLNKLILEVAEYNSSAFNFYVKHGFYSENSEIIKISRRGLQVGIKLLTLDKKSFSKRQIYTS